MSNEDNILRPRPYREMKQKAASWLECLLAVLPDGRQEAELLDGPRGFSVPLEELEIVAAGLRVEVAAIEGDEVVEVAKVLAGEWSGRWADLWAAARVLAA